MARFRSVGEIIDFSDLVIPSYPIRYGAQFYSQMNEKPEYISTERTVGTTDLELSFVNLKTTDRTTLYDYWYTSLNEGADKFTYLDHKKRLLFYCNWYNWNELWRKRRGGIYDVKVPIVASNIFTPSCLAFYPMLSASGSYLYDYNTWTGTTSSNIINIDDGAKRDGSDGQRANSYCFRIGNDLLFGINGASTTSAELTTSRIDNSQSICLQYYVGAVETNKEVGIITLENSSTGKKMELVSDKIDASTLQFQFKINGTTYCTIDGSVDVWYDICITYDDIQDNAYLYVMPYDTTGSFTNYLGGVATLADGYDESTTTGEVVITNYDTIKLLQCGETNVVTAGNFAVLQNIFIFDEFLSPNGFNHIRQLYYLWNKDTEVQPR